MAALDIDIRSPLTAKLQSSVQARLGQLGYASADDDVMAEYVVVMLANRKGADAVSEEMQDLIGDEYDPSFVEWLWDEAEHILNGGEPRTTRAETSTARHRSRTRSPQARRESHGRADRDYDRRSHRDEDEEMSRRSVSPQRRGSRRADRSAIRPQRELFAAAMQSLERPSLRDGVRGARPAAPRGDGGNELILRGAAARGGSGLAMDDPRLQSGRAGPVDFNDHSSGGGDSGPLRRLDLAGRERRSPPRELFGQGREPPTGPRQAAPHRAYRGEQPGAEDDLRRAAKDSLFSRMSVPNPKAPEFVPRKGHGGSAEQPPRQEQSLLSRIGGRDDRGRDGPEMRGGPVPERGWSSGPSAPPNGPRHGMGSHRDMAPPQGMGQQQGMPFGGPAMAMPPQMMIPSHPNIDPSRFPRVPSSTASCEYLLKCTNPMCPKSHPTPCLANTADEADALMLSQEACEEGPECKNKDCTRSHVSPAVSVISSRLANDPSFMEQQQMMQQQQQQMMQMMMMAWQQQQQQQQQMRQRHGPVGMQYNPHWQPPVFDEEANRPPKCKYQQECTNPQCAFSHYDADGKIVPAPGLLRLSSLKQAAAASRKAHVDGDGDKEMTAAPEGEAAAAAAAAKAGSGGAAACKPALDRPLSDAPVGGTRCKFGYACTRPGCAFLHPTGRRIDGATAPGSSGSSSAEPGKTPCRFGAACFRADCHFAHPPGRVVGAQAAKSGGANGNSNGNGNGASHISERLAKFSAQQEGEPERIIPATS